VANLALGELYTGDRKKAWQMISAELRHPTASSQKDLCRLHLATIQILQDIVYYDFAPPDPDRIAKQSYDYICENCQDFKRIAMGTESQYGNYFYLTKRPGFALTHYKRSLILCPKGSFDHMNNENNIAVCYADMGKFELRDYHKVRAIKTGREYLKKRRTYKYKLDEFAEWDAYKVILQSRLSNLSSAENATDNLPEMYELWKEIESINQKWYSKPKQYLAYHHASQAFAGVGDSGISLARKLFDRAEELVQKYLSENQEVAQFNLQIVEASILRAEGKLKEAAALWEDWIERFQRISGRLPSANSYRLAGLAQESAQNYDHAIEHLEKAIGGFEIRRSSFEVKSRGRVLSGLIATTYWGLIRSYTGRYVEQKQEADFQGAIKAARMLRARQFAELLGIEYRIDDHLDISKLKLDPDELLLNIAVTDQAIIIFAISSEWHDLVIIPYEGSIFNAAAKRAKSQILTPGDPEAFINDIQVISEIILTPIKSRLDGIKRLIVIPDGLLNGIPFTLLSKSSDHYYPLIFDHEVVLTPSISYLMKQRDSKYQFVSDKLLALADPVYGSRTVPEAYRDDTMRFYKRAVNDFNLFVPLPETRAEVENIAGLFRPTDVTSFFGNKATETNVKSIDLEGYRYLHFATHGILGNQIPGIDEPALVLAAEPEDSGQDGFLTLSEVEDLKLNSELTVLSACDTGSGKYFTGEGIMGLSRAFLLAGSRSVIVSFWPVASEATVELMTLFYHNLRSGRSKAESLRLAQLALMGGKEAKSSTERGLKVTGKVGSGTYAVHPFYWAPFVLIGE